MSPASSRPKAVRPGATVPARRTNHRRRSRHVVPVVLALGAVVAVAGLVTGEPTQPPEPPDQPDRPSTVSGALAQRLEPPFRDDSWWNTPLPGDAPRHPQGSDILDYLRTAPDSGRGCLMLAGAGESHWGTPLYWTEPSDPEYDVTGVVQQRPPELRSLRIPVGARPASNSDDSMSIFDVDRGYVVALTDAEYDEDDDTWTAGGATVTYLDSNGLHVDTGRSDDPRNIGSHRGNNGATMAVSWDQVQDGAVRHVLKIAAGPEVANRYVFPMVGSDGDYEGSRPEVPPQGLRLRIKASVDLQELDLHPEALVIARALQRFGAYIGDSGGTTALKLENTRAEGRGQAWHLPADALCGLPFTDDWWTVVAEGYDPTR
jgi:hypothetical protein